MCLYKYTIIEKLALARHNATDGARQLHIRLNAFLQKRPSDLCTSDLKLCFSTYFCYYAQCFLIIHQHVELTKCTKVEGESKGSVQKHASHPISGKYSNVKCI